MTKIEPVKLHKLLYRVEEVQALLSFGKDTIYGLIDDGELIAHCHNGVKLKPVRIVGTSIAEYVARHQVTSQQRAE